MAAIASWIGAGSALLGAAGGLFSGGGGGQTGTANTFFNQTSSSSPWSQIQPYLTGGTNADGSPISGVIPTASNLFNSTGWTPAMQNALNAWSNNTSNNQSIFQGTGGQNVGGALLQGQYDPRITAAGQINGAPFINAPQVTGASFAAPSIAGTDSIVPQNVSLTAARQGQGALDPTNALGGILNNTQTNPWITDQQNAITGQMTRNFNENVLPGIRQTAIADGQYGGSRGDIANALATSRLNTDLSGALSGLASNAWENSQNRAMQTGLSLNQQAGDTATGNANRALTADTTNAANALQAGMFNAGNLQQAGMFNAGNAQQAGMANASNALQAGQFNAGNVQQTQQFNTGTSLANNAQAMQAAAARTQNVGAGLSALGGAQGLTDQYGSGLMQSLTTPDDYQWSNYGRYAGSIQPYAGMFPTTTTSGSGSQPMYGGSPIAGAAGGALSGLAIGNSLFGRNGMFAGAGSTGGFPGIGGGTMGGFS